MPNWAYDLDCDLTLDGMVAALNSAGTWQWQSRESYWYGDYLNARPVAGLRVRIHQYPQTVGSGTQFTGPRDHGFMALLEIRNDSSASRDEVDRIFRDLLARINATIVSAIDPYD
ncbi:MAG TPA: hypothetical protein VKW06_17225 [Candidatus Angelobacter sp.]|nr:hypothetical protein [Candidatus Angelobacter sp.]